MNAESFQDGAGEPPGGGVPHNPTADPQAGAQRGPGEALDAPSEAERAEARYQAAWATGARARSEAQYQINDSGTSETASMPALVCPEDFMVLNKPDYLTALSQLAEVEDAVREMANGILYCREHVAIPEVLHNLLTLPTVRRILDKPLDKTPDPSVPGA